MAYTVTSVTNKLTNRPIVIKENGNFMKLLPITLLSLNLQINNYYSILLHKSNTFLLIVLILQTLYDFTHDLTNNHKLEST